MPAGTGAARTEGGGPTPGAATRLLVLGCVRIFQPVHGYFLRRELLSWNVDEWARVHPGSIYNALRQLTRTGLLEELPATSAGGRPARTSYRLTDDGEREYLAALRSTLRGVEDPTAFLTAINFASGLPRAEVVEAMEDRLRLLHAHVAEADRVVEQVLAARDTPDTASEVPRLIRARVLGEIAWTEDYLERIRAGAYSFVGEPPSWHPSDEAVAAALAEGALIDAAPWRARPDPETRNNQG